MENYCREKLSESNIRQLVNKGKTNELKGFVSRSGNKFNASLYMKDDFTIGFAFGEREKVVGENN
ncbi:topoisomerase C-terminal repeat-containing protein [Chondrinema litorale]|uniref:topoisomerase C-terminal repeat-containing protein n=1 Tax=Chondrinema litorale TaxID=2994555 RepID=UPI003D6ECC93